MPRLSRRNFTLLAATGAAGALIPSQGGAQSPTDVPGEFQHVEMLPGIAGPYPDLAGVDPAAPIPARWVPATAAALPALPPLMQSFEDRCVLYRPARAGFNLHAYGYENHKLGMVQHIPVCDTLQQLTNYFTGGQNTGLTTYGVGRPVFATLDLTAADGSVWRVPFAEVHRYGPLSGAWSPWAQGVVNRGGSCAVPAHPVAAYLGSGVPNGAYDSVENVARTGAQGMTSAQLNSNAMLRAMSAFRWDYEISDDTQVSHAQIDRVNRCFDPGWPAGLEEVAREAARGILRGDLSLMADAVQVGAKPSVDWQTEAYQALINKRLRVQADAYAAELRDAADERTNQALQGLDPAGWQAVALGAWEEQLERDRDDIQKATVRRDAALAQLARLRG